ncbi:MAG: hypothetical protein J6W00_03615 [Lentisphaeria bacterium]|nr:hypothetical protein [Lentisphaeria bacterium]
MLQHPSFVNDGYEKRPGCLPKGKLVLENLTPDEAQAIVDEYFESHWQECGKPACGELKHPYLVPGGPYQNMWDWDAYFTACFVPESGIEHAKGSLLNLLEAPLFEGRPTKKATAEGEYEYTMHPFPLRAQFAAVIAKRIGDVEFLRKHWDALIETIKWYEKDTCDQDGFFIWQNYSGIDNAPSIYGRTLGTVAGIDLASFHVREYEAVSVLAEKLGLPDPCAGKAEKLSAMIRQYYYDKRQKFFYDIDRCCNVNPFISRQYLTWVTRIIFRSCLGIFPLWSKSASAEQAEAVKNIMMDEEEFLSPVGFRTHSKADTEIYNNALSGNPSNWQGPVWGLTTGLAIYGLMNYGYKAEAEELAKRILILFASDIKQNGCLHEYYHADTAQPVMKPGFQNWNTMMYKILPNIRKGYNPMDF